MTSRQVARVAALTALLLAWLSLASSDALAAGRSTHEAAVSWQGYYASEAGGDGAEVDVFLAYEGQAVYVDFKLPGKLPDQAWGAVRPCEKLTRNSFSFSFTDRSGCERQGTFSRRGGRFLLHVNASGKCPPGTVPDPAAGDQALVKKGARGRTDRNPWSMGRTQVAPSWTRPSPAPTPSVPAPVTTPDRH